MSIYDKYFGKKKEGNVEEFSIRSSNLVPEIAKIDVRKDKGTFNIHLSFSVGLSADSSEGWKTGIAIDASSSMKGSYGRMVEGKIPDKLKKTFEKNNLIEKKNVDGRAVVGYKQEAVDIAIKEGYLKKTENIVEPVALKFIDYLYDNLEAYKGTELVYWACGDGKEYESVGTFNSDNIKDLKIQGPKELGFGSGTVLTPVIKYFIEKYIKEKRGLYVFITDGKIEDIDDVKEYTKQLAVNIEAGDRNFVKLILIGVGEEIDENQMIELDNLDTGTDIDIWDHKISKEMRELSEIFAELVDENEIITSTGIIYDSFGNILKKYSDGLPAKIDFTMNENSEWFEIEVPGKKIKQQINR